MTTPESIVTSLDWSKKLKEAGWPQEDAIWYWVGHMLDDNMEPTSWSLWPREKEEYREQWKPHIHAAPTAEEILRRLPLWIKSKKNIVRTHAKSKTISGQRIKFHLERFDGGYALFYGTKYSPLCYVEGDTLANAAAAMYCYLAEQKLLPSA